MSLKRISLLAPQTVGAPMLPLPPLSYAAGPAPAPVCGRPEAPSEASWAPTSTTFDEAAGYGPCVGNGYLGHHVPATGAGYAATGEKTGWPTTPHGTTAPSCRGSTPGTRASPRAAR